MSAALASSPSLSVSSASSVVNPCPVPLREQAFALHCDGLRSPAISQQLGVPERTVRAWIAADLKALAEEQRATRHQQLALAVARQQDLTAAAWQQFESETAARAALLDAVMSAVSLLATPSHSADAAEPLTAGACVPETTSVALPRLPASTPAPRYLSLILQANREINRLLGLYHIAKLDALTPDLPSHPTAPEIPAESATASIETPAESATASAVSETPAESAAHNSGLAPGLQPAMPGIPPDSPSIASARPAAPLSPQGEGPGVRTHSPAESAMPLPSSASSPSHSAPSALKSPSSSVPLRDLRGKSSSSSGRIAYARKPNRRPSAGRKSPKSRRAHK